MTCMDMANTKELRVFRGATGTDLDVRFLQLMPCHPPR